MEEMIESFLLSNNLAIQFIAVGVLIGVILKPLLDIAKAIAAFTKTTKDDEIIQKVEGSYVFQKSLAFFTYLKSLQNKKK